MSGFKASTALHDLIGYCCLVDDLIGYYYCLVDDLIGYHYLVADGIDM